MKVMRTDRIRRLYCLAFIIIITTVIASVGVQGQSRATTSETETGTETGDITENEHVTTGPTGFGDLDLGLQIDDVKKRLRGDSNFLFRGDPDVSMLAQPNESLIEAAGASFVERGYFQFYEKRLYTIILELDRERMDYYTMYSTFVAKYGEPTYLDPKETVWVFESVQVSLERPLRVKYIDTVAFNRILTEQNRTESYSRMTRDMFLGGF